MEHPLLGAIAEDHVAELDPPPRDLELRHVRRVFLEVLLLEEIVSMPTPNSADDRSTCSLATRFIGS